MDDAPLSWPAGIDPLISTDDLRVALACRSEACVIGLAHHENQRDQVRLPFFFHGDRLRCLGLAHMLALNIAMFTSEEEEDLHD
jgi:hypothetical protein